MALFRARRGRGGCAPNGRECVHPMHAIMYTQCTRTPPPNARDHMHPMDANERSLALLRSLAGLAANAPWLPCCPCLPCLSPPSLPFQRAATSRGNRAPVPSWAICASCDLSAYAYTPSGRSPAQLAASWLRFARLTTPVVAALGNSGGVVSGARVHRSAPCAAVGRSRSVHRQSAAVCFVAQFRGGCRSIAASRILPAPCRARSAPHPPSRTSPCSSPLPRATTSLGEPNP